MFVILSYEAPENHEREYRPSLRHDSLFLALQILMTAIRPIQAISCNAWLSQGSSENIYISVHRKL